MEIEGGGAKTILLPNSDLHHSNASNFEMENATTDDRRNGDDVMVMMVMMVMMSQTTDNRK
eukprot:scaffold453_cov278-Chaetoceros_neogracile.AAC.11